MNDIAKQQVTMHRDMFDRCRAAIENGYFLEAIFLEYAAIEGRLEVILGILGMPCNKYLEPKIRKKINVSDRIECLHYYRKNCSCFTTTKLPPNFFSSKGTLKKWIDNRNTYIHGLYKRAEVYTGRKNDSKRIAEEGYEYTRLLYNEARRLSRLAKNHPDILAESSRKCRKSKCQDKIEN